MKKFLAKSILFCLALCIATGAEARGYFSFFDKMAIATVVVGAVAIAAAHPPCGKKSKGKHSCKPDADNGIQADTTSVATPASDVQSINTDTPWRDISAPDVLVDGFDTAPDIEGVPGRYWEGMSAEDILIEKSNSEILGDNLRNNGEPKPVYADGGRSAAHHLIPATSPKSARLRMLLKQYDIDINSAENGAWLPHNDRQPQSGRTYHGDTYGDDYYRYLESKILHLTNKEGILGAIAEVKQQLLNGETPWKR